jgi:putative serine protease PepD
VEEADENPEDDGPLFSWLPPDDRLWRHPSEVGSTGPAAPASENPAGGEQQNVSSRPARSAATRTWSVAVLAGVVGAVLASSVGMATGVFDHQTTVVQAVTKYVTSDTVAWQSSTIPLAPNWPAITDQLAPSIVTVAVTGSNGPSSASGVLFAAGNNRSYILTDRALVVGGGQIQVQFNDGEKQTGHMVGQDPKTGMAVLWASGSERVYPTVGSVADLRLAEQVMTLGARNANGNPIVVSSVSGVDQDVDPSTGTTLAGMVALSGSQLPASDAGGALIDASGNVVGLTTSVSSSETGQQNLTFAVPIDMAEHVAGQLIEGQAVTHPWIGVGEVTDLSTLSAAQLGVPGGVIVGSVAARSPATAAGLRTNDVIVRLGDQPVTTAGMVTAWLDGHCTPGQTIPVSFIRNGRTLSASLTVVEQPTLNG